MRSLVSTKPSPSFRWESEIRASGFDCIAGVDEVGRGALAGPVVAAAVILPPTLPDSVLSLINDSKALSNTQRQRAFTAIKRVAYSVGIGSCDAAEVDRFGISTATKSAMRRAIADSSTEPDFVLVDAVRDIGISMPYLPIVKGDAQSLSIAAASIVAKVTRDEILATRCESKFPEYGFAQHKGYGTARHLEALRRYGPSPLHRKTFRPVADMLVKRNSDKSQEQALSSGRYSKPYSLPSGTGRTGEIVAARRLTELGYRILRRNQRTRYGEIDIIALQDGQLVFLEVKTRRIRRRSGGKFMDSLPVESMTPRKARRVSQCAEAYLALSGYNHRADWRMDFVGVDLGVNGNPVQVQVIQNIEVE